MRNVMPEIVIQISETLKFSLDWRCLGGQGYRYSIIRSGAAADRRTPLKPGAQLDLASPYAVPRSWRTESPTSLNYAKLCVEPNYTGAAIGWNVGWSCHTSYCIGMIYVEPAFPKIQAGKRLWSTRRWRRQRIERRISWEAWNLEGYWFVVYVK